MRNKVGQPHGESDQNRLTTIEEAITAVRLGELRESPLTGEFDYDHMKAIREYVFQDIYDWAGQERVGSDTHMEKDGHLYYPAGRALTEAAERQYAALAAKNYLRGLDHDEFVEELAEAWGEINVVHSFREGNTRTQFVFFSQLAERAGYRIDTSAFAPGSPPRVAFIEARYESQRTGSNARLAAVLRQAIIAIPA